MVFDSIEDMAESYKDELFRFLDGKKEFPMNGSSLDSLCEELVDLIFTRSGLAMNGQVISYFRDGDPIESSRRILSGRTEEQQYRKDLVDSLMGISLISRTWTEADLYTLSTEQLEDLEAHPRAQTNYADSLDPVYREGYEAGLNPDKSWDNPYYGQSFEGKRWNEGWKAGRLVYYEQHPDYVSASARRRINSSFRDEFANALKSIMRKKGVEFKAWDSVDDAMDDIYDNYIEQYYSIDDLYDKGPKALAKEWFEASYSDDEYADDEEQMFTH